MGHRKNTLWTTMEILATCKQTQSVYLEEFVMNHLEKSVNLWLLSCVVVSICLFVFLIRFRCMQISFLSMQFFDCSIHNKCEKYCFSLFCSDVTQATTQTGEELWQMCEYFIINVLVLNFGFRWLFIHPYGICVISLNSQKEM